MIYELRVYHCAPGRLPALHQRFTQVTLALFQKHGIEQAGFFTTVVGASNQTLTYLLKWESLAQREAKWTAFATDPEWVAARRLRRPTASSSSASRIRSWSRPRIRRCAERLSSLP